jgi:hypothetical protein
MSGNSLQHFRKDQFIISRQQAARVLRFMFPDQQVSEPQLSDEDIGFAQALLIEAVDSSREMGYVQILFEKAAYKVPTDFSFIKDLAKELCKRALQNWFRHATRKDLSDPQIYEMVLNTLRRNFRSVWAIRVQTGELTY